jgi:uncharacterized protein (UPF0218 family)
MRRISTTMRTGMQEKKKEGAEEQKGLLIRGSFDETMTQLKKLIDTEKPPMIISIGDVVSGNVIKYGIGAQVLVVDNQAMREAVTPLSPDVEQTLYLKNPPQMLADEAFSVMQKAIESGKKTRILVDGEEDLMSIVAVIYAPLGAFVIYGQPREGIVVVRVTEQRKVGMRGLVDRMERVS